MQRNGYEENKGLIFVLNNLGNAWNGRWVQTKWKNTRFIPMAWYSHNDSQAPSEKWTGNEGWGEFWAPPRGYAVYVPQ
jgi:alpha-amylase